MQVKVTFRNSDSRDEIKKHAEEKIEKIKKFMHTPIQVGFILSKDKMDHVSELTVSGEGAHLSSSVSAGDYFTAIDESIEKMLVQLKKHKEKMKDRKGSKKPEIL
ncbi:MAG: ribosome-associated translation inhibitor RaiA [bacterium]